MKVEYISKEMLSKLAYGWYNSPSFENDEARTLFLSDHRQYIDDLVAVLSQLGTVSVDGSYLDADFHTGYFTDATKSNFVTCYKINKKILVTLAQFVKAMYSDRMIVLDGALPSGDFYMVCIEGNGRMCAWSENESLVNALL